MSGKQRAIMLLSAQLIRLLCAELHSRSEGKVDPVTEALMDLGEAVREAAFRAIMEDK